MNSQSIVTIYNFGQTATPANHRSSHTFIISSRSQVDVEMRSLIATKICEKMLK